LGVIAFSAQCYEAVTAGRLVCPGVLNADIRFETGGSGVTVRWGYSGDALAVTAFNAVISAVGQAAIVADSALDQVLGPRDSKDTSPTGSLRAVIYMVRCAFAHSPQAPVWECRGPYHATFRVREAALTFDGSLLDGKPMRLLDIGGLEAFVRLLQSAEWIAAKSRNVATPSTGD